MKKARLQIWILVAGMVASVSTARSQTITGSLWENHGVDATPANVPSTAPDVIFSVPNGPLNFDNPNSTIGAWLATGGASITSGAGDAGNTFNNSFIKIVGFVSVNHGQQFTVTHDDGLTFIIGTQTVINSPGPTAPVQTFGTYNGPSGNQPFTLVYSEVFGGPAVLQLDLPLTPVPEPSTYAAGALMLLTFGTGTFRMLRKKLAA